MQDRVENKEINEYADLLPLCRPRPMEILQKYPPMPVEERAKIFSPFAALRGHDEDLEEEDERLLQVERRLLSEEESLGLNERLAALRKGAHVRLVRFVQARESKGKYETLTGYVTALHEAFHTLQISDKVEPGGRKEVNVAMEDVVMVEEI